MVPIFPQPYRYLQKYGYIGSTSDLASHAYAADGAIRQFQQYAKLPVTGKMDAKTQRMLTAPRCGAQDFRPVTSSAAALSRVQGIPVRSFRDMRRKKRYVQAGTRWNKQVKHIACFIQSNP